MRSKIAFVMAAGLLAAPALAQDTKPAEQPAQPLPVNTPAPAPGDSKIDDKLNLDTGWPFFHGWKGGVEIGINGSEGNSESLNVHAGINAERKTDLNDTKASLIYLRASSDGSVTKNRAELDLRNDWIFSKGSPWRAFLEGTAEYDDFQDWQYRLTLMGGIGYAFIESERTTLVGRVGAGIRDDLLGPDNRIHPEALLGLDWSYKISDRQKITTTAEFYPDLLNTGQYRAKLKAEWELLVDPETKMSLKIGAEDRYQSHPGDGKKKNDLDYFALLVWSF